MTINLFALISGFVAIGFAVYLIWRVMRYSAGEGKMVEISQAIAEGAKAYLNRQYRAVAVVAVIVSALLWWSLGLRTMTGFLIGALASALAGYIGMNVAVRANVRTAQAAKSGLKPALEVAFLGGAVTGLLVVGLALLAVVALGNHAAVAGTAHTGACTYPECCINFLLLQLHHPVAVFLNFRRKPPNPHWRGEA